MLVVLVVLVTLVVVEVVLIGCCRTGVSVVETTFDVVRAVIFLCTFDCRRVNISRTNFVQKHAINVRNGL